MPNYHRGDEPGPGYRLVASLGKGGFGEVWRATGPSGNDVAVKIIDLTQGMHMLKEFRALERIKNVRHPHIASIHRFWLKDRSGHFLDLNQLEKLGTADLNTLCSE